MKKPLVLGLLFAVSGLLSPLAAQTLRLEANLSKGTSFENQIENRYVTEDVLNSSIPGITTKWNMKEVRAIGPIGLSYLHPIGSGRLNVGFSHEQYSYSGDFSTIIMMNANPTYGTPAYQGFGMGTVDTYKYSMNDVHAGYEVKADKLLITPRMGRRSYSHEYASSRTDIMMPPAPYVYQIGSKHSSSKGDAAGLYFGVGVEFAITESVSLIADYARTLSPLTGSATMGDSYSQLYSLSGSRGSIIGGSVSSNDMQVDYAGYKLGVQFGSNTLKFKVGLMQDAYSVSYPNRMDIGLSFLGGGGALVSAVTHPFTDSDATKSWVVRQAIWGAKGTDKRTGIFYGITKDINF